MFKIIYLLATAIHQRENQVKILSTFCDFAMNNSDCSYLFKEMHVSATILQALGAFVIAAISVITNLLLIASMVIYCSNFDNSVILSISFLVANIIVAVFLNGEIFFTSLFRAWLIGYWGCQMITFFITCGLFARWFTVAVISLDRFCRIFFTFTYPRHSKKVVIALTVCSWVISLVTAVIFLTTNAVVFAVSIPGCMFSPLSEQLTKGGKSVVELTLWLTRFMAICIPPLLYTAMYIKGRLMKLNIYPFSPFPNSDSPLPPQTHNQANKGSLTYFFMLLPFVYINIIVIIEAVIEIFLLNMGVPVSTVVPILYVFTFLTEIYLLLDDVIMLINSQQRMLLCKMLIKLLCTCV